MKAIILTLLLLLISVDIVQSEDIEVSRGESIQDAIDRAQPGDTVWVESGTYKEDIVIDKSIFLEGWNSGGGLPVIDAEGGENAIIISVDSANRIDIHDAFYVAVLEGFRVKNAEQSGLLTISSNNYIHSIEATENENGITIKSNDNFMEAIKSRSNKQGIYLDSSETNAIGYSNAENNQQSGITLSNSHSNQIYTTRVSNNREGIRLESSEGNILQNNNLVNNRRDNAYDDMDANSWFRNHFSDYDQEREGCTDDPYDGDRFCDSPYIIPGPEGSSLNQDEEAYIEFKNEKLPDARGRAKNRP